MYIPETVSQHFEIFYRLRIWSRNDVPTYWEIIANYFHFTWLVLFLISLFIGACNTGDADESVFLLIVTVAYVVLVYRLGYIIWRKNGLLSLVHRIGTHYHENQTLFRQYSKTLNVFMKIVRFYLMMLVIGASPLMFVYPITSEKHLFLFNIAFPLDRSSPSKIGFWMAYIFVIGSVCDAVICTLFISTGWYLMLCLSIEYKLLGDQLQHLGDIRIVESVFIASQAEHLKRFEKEVGAAVERHKIINETLNEFQTYFGKLFLLQVATGSVCICGGVYALAFSSHVDPVKDLYSCAFLSYSIFDIFVIMYLGNEVKVSSEKLSYHLYDSNWIQQKQLGKQSVIILSERLKQPQKIIVGKIFPLDLGTLTQIIKAAYSLFNVLFNMRT